MKNLKKITALVIVLAMALSSVAFASYSDVAEDASYNEAVQVMSALGLLKGYEDGTFGPDKTITRAEFSAVIVRALGMEEAAAGAAVNTIFPDVPASHWASGYVQIANQQGIVLGYEDGTFGPDDEVLYEQAVTMIERALDYDIKYADDEDAYPTAYLAQANADNITVGATGKIGDKATRAIVARLVYNALDVPMLVQTTIGGIYGDQYAVSTKGETLLTTKLKIAKVEATVGSLNFGAEEADEITLNVTKGDLNYDKYVGVEDYTEDTIGSVVIGEGVDVAAMTNYACVAYVDLEDDSEPVLRAIAPKAGKNKTMVLTMKQLESIDATTANEIKYYKNDSNDDKTLKVKIDSNLKAYYNLDASDMGDAEFENLPNAEFTALKLIENDGDNSYDVAVVEQYKSFVVEAVNTRTNTIRKNTAAKFTYTDASKIELDPEDETITWSITDVEGNEVALESIVKDNVVNVAVSTDASANTYYDIVVTTDVVSGVVSESSVINGITYYTVGEGEYKVAGNDTSYIKVGDEGAFVVDMAGNILHKTAVEGGAIGDFAFIIGMEDDVEFNTYTYRLSIMNNKGEFSVVTLADKIRINDGSQVEASSVYDPTVKAMNSTLVGYKLNASGEVSHLYTDFSKMSSSYASVNPSSDLTYKDDGRIGNYFVTEGLNIINSKANDLASTKKEDLSLVSVAALSDGEGYDIETLVYDINSFEVVIAIGLGIQAAADPASAPMIITSIGTKNDSNGDPAVLVKGYVDTELVSIIITDETEFEGAVTDKDDFVKGDVIQYTVDANGEASGVATIFTAAQLMGSSIIGDVDTQDDDAFVYGDYVYNVNGSVVYFAGADRDDDEYDAVTLAGSFASVEVTLDTDSQNNLYIRAIDGDASFADVNTDKLEGDAVSNTDKLFVYKYDNAAKIAIVVTIAD